MISTLKFSGVKYKTFLLTVTLKLIKMCLDFAVESGQKNNCLNLILAHNLYSRAVPVHIKKKRPTYVRQRLNSKRSIKKKRCRFSVDKLQPWFLSWKMKMNECWVNICVWISNLCLSRRVLWRKIFSRMGSRGWVVNIGCQCHGKCALSPRV